MPSSDEYALDWVVKNQKIEPQKAAEVMTKLGVNISDVKAWEWSSRNPTDERSTDVRNRIFTKLAEGQRPTDTTKGFPAVDRFLIKNLADKNDTKSISKYMQDRGFVTRVKDGQVQIRKPEDKSYIGIEPKDIDWFDLAGWVKETAQDVTDVSKELIEGGVITLTTGLKALGSIAGPAGFAATSAVSGATTAGVETVRQALAKGIGLRESINPRQIAEAGAVGLTLPAVAGATGKVLEGIGTGFGKIIGKFRDFAIKPNAKEIQKSAEAIGAKATPSQLFRSESIRKLEEALVKGDDLKIGGIISGLPKQIEINKRAVLEHADNIVKERSFREGFDVGSQVGRDLTKIVKERLAPAEAIYNKVSNELGGIPAQKLEIIRSLREIYKDIKFSEDGRKVLFETARKLKRVKTVNDLKLLRTAVMNEVPTNASKNTRIVSSQVYQVLTEARNKSLYEAASPELASQLKVADSIYKNTIKDIEKVILAGKKTKLTPRQTIEGFLENTIEIKRINKILDTGDPKRIQELRRAYPNIFENLRKQKIEEIARNSEVGGQVDPTRLSNIIVNLPERTQVLLFGAKGTRDAKVLKNYLDSLARPFNTSNTENMKKSMNWNLFEQLGSLRRSVILDILTSSQLNKGLLQKTGRGLQKPITKGLVVGGRNALLPKKEEKEEGE